MRYFADYIKGKPYQKTVLWENSSPSSSFAGGQTITLEDDITNYDQLEIQWCLSTSALTNKKSIIVPVSEFIASGSNSSVSCKTYTGQYNGSTNNVRQYYYASNTTISVTASYSVASSGYNDATNIPLRIIGIKKGLGEIKNVETINVDAIRNAQFTAVVGHRYIVAFASLYGEGGTPSAHITGLDVITASNIARTAQYSSLDTTLQVVIGIATSTTVKCTHRTDSVDTYSDICAIDLDDQ